MTLFARVPHEEGWHIADYLDTFGLDGCFVRRGALPTDFVANKLVPTKDFLLIEVPHNAPPELIPKLLRQLKPAKVVAIDVIFANKRAEIPPAHLHLFGAEPARWQREDNLLAAAIKESGNVIIGCWPNTKRVPVPGKLNKTTPLIEWQHPPDVIWNAARWHAHLLVEPSPIDGKTRSVHLFKDVKFSDTKTALQMPSLSLAAAAASENLTQNQLGHLKIQRNQLTLGNHTVSVPQDGLMTIDYLGGREEFDNSAIHWNYSFAIDDIGPEDVAGKIVFLGRTDFTAKDDFTTPFDNMPGVHVHMHAVSTLLGSERAPSEIAFWQTWLIAFACCIVLVLSLQRLSLMGSLAVGLLLCVLIFLSCYQLFIDYHRYFPTSVPVLAVILTYNGIALFEYGRTRAVLAKFVGRDFVRTLMHPLRSLSLGGQSEVATAFFCDLRGFSTASEHLPSSTTEPLVTAYTSTVTEVAMRFGGRVIDYFGDGIFILFQESSKKSDANHAVRAVQAAVQAQTALAKVLTNWTKLAGVELTFAVGINSGEMIIGVIGSEEHMKLGAVGDTVNVAARVQGLTNQCDYGILVTKETQDLIGDQIALTSCGQFAVKGRQQEVWLFGTGQVKQAMIKTDEVEAKAVDSMSLINQAPSVELRELNKPNV